MCSFINPVLGFRLARPATCPPAIYTVMTKCWEADSHERPSFNELESRFTQIADILKATEADVWADTSTECRAMFSPASVSSFDADVALTSKDHQGEQHEKAVQDTAADVQDTVLTDEDVGKGVFVEGHGQGTIRFVGLHQEKKTLYCGVELVYSGDGNHDGTVDGFTYFQCQPGFGVLCPPTQVCHKHWQYCCVRR